MKKYFAIWDEKLCIMLSIIRIVIFSSIVMVEIISLGTKGKELYQFKHN